MHIKFIHSADIHIDSPLRALAAHDSPVVGLLRTATRAAFTNLINRAIDEEVGFIVLAGDIFDRGCRDINTGMFFHQEMVRCHRAGIRVVIVRGNHDAENDMTRTLPPPDNVYIFRSDAPHTIKFDDCKIALHGQSYRHAETKDNLVAYYPAPLEGWINIGVLHTGLEGQNVEHASYAKCSIDELRNKGYQYMALGHIHQHAIYSESPYVVMPGSLQGRHPKELGPRGAVLVSCEHGEVLPPERIYVDVVRWALADVNISSANTREDCVTLAADAFRNLIAQADGRPVACRVQFTGKSMAHGSLFGQEQRLRQDLTAQALNVAGDNLWIEKIKVRSEPTLDAATVEARGDALGELQALLNEVAADPEFQATLPAEFAILLSKMPLDVFRQEVPALTAAKAGDFASLLPGIAPAVLDRIAKEG